MLPGGPIQWELGRDIRQTCDDGARPHKTGTQGGLKRDQRPDPPPDGPTDRRPVGHALSRCRLLIKFVVAAPQRAA